MEDIAVYRRQTVLLYPFQYHNYVRKQLRECIAVGSLSMHQFFVEESWFALESVRVEDLLSVGLRYVYLELI